LYHIYKEASASYSISVADDYIFGNLPETVVHSWWLF